LPGRPRLKAFDRATALGKEYQQADAKDKANQRPAHVHI
jgi:hypothetical protein